MAKFKLKKTKFLVEPPKGSEIPFGSRFQKRKILTIADVRRINVEKGQFFFSPKTMKFFASKIETKGPLINNKYFITSEKSSFEDTMRKFTVRGFDKKTGTVFTQGGFGQFLTKAEAKKFAEGLK